MGTGTALGAKGKVTFANIVITPLFNIVNVCVHVTSMTASTCACAIILSVISQSVIGTRQRLIGLVYIQR